MISFEAYKVLHLIGVVAVFAALGGVAVHAGNGGSRPQNTLRRVISALHGLGLIVILIAGFGMIARLGLFRSGLQAWVYGKLAVWMAAGALLAIPYRRPAAARGILMIGLPVLGAIAAWLAIYKPG